MVIVILRIINNGSSDGSCCVGDVVCDDNGSVCGRFGSGGIGDGACDGGGVVGDVVCKAMVMLVMVVALVVMALMMGFGMVGIFLAK